MRAGGGLGGGREEEEWGYDRSSTCEEEKARFFKGRKARKSVKNLG